MTAFLRKSDARATADHAGPSGPVMSADDMVAAVRRLKAVPPAQGPAWSPPPPASKQAAAMVSTPIDGPSLGDRLALFARSRLVPAVEGTARSARGAWRVLRPRVRQSMRDVAAALARWVAARRVAARRRVGAAEASAAPAAPNRTAWTRFLFGRPVTRRRGGFVPWLFETIVRLVVALILLPIRVVYWTVDWAAALAITLVDLALVACAAVGLFVILGAGIGVWLLSDPERLRDAVFWGVELADTHRDTILDADAAVRDALDIPTGWPFGIAADDADEVAPVDRDAPADRPAAFSPAFPPPAPGVPAPSRAAPVSPAPAATPPTATPPTATPPTATPPTAAPASPYGRWVPLPIGPN